MNICEHDTVCSGVVLPTLAKTDNTETSPYTDSDTKFCYYETEFNGNRANLFREAHLSRTLTAIDASELIGIAKSSKLCESSSSSENEEMEMNSIQDSDMYNKLEVTTFNREDNTRVSDSESCSSGENSCLNIVEPGLKRKLNQEYLVEISSPDLGIVEENREDDEEIDFKKPKLENNDENNDVDQEYIIQSKETPVGIRSWLDQFQEWSIAEKMVALNQLIDVCESAVARHLLEVIEPQFQRDFISMLPKELALYVLSFLCPRDLLRAAQTCRYWKCLSEDNLLWREKCREAGVDQDSIALALKRKNRVPNSITSAWKLAFLRSHAIEMNWRRNPVKASKVLKGHDDHVITCLQFCGNKIVSGSDDNTLKVWSAVTGKCLRTLIGHNGGVWSSQMQEDIIISGSTDRTLRVWNADTGDCIHVLSGHTSTVRCMHLHGKIVVSGSRDATLRMWDIETGECLHILVGHTAAVRCVQYDGQLVVSGAYDNSVKVWDPTTEVCLHTLDEHKNRVYSLQFDGTHIVSGSLDTSIRVWDVRTGALKHTLMGHQSLTSGMELRQNILVSGNADSTVKVWDILSGRCLQTLAGKNRHESAVTCLQFNSNFVITSSDDGTVKLWDLRTGEFIRNLVKLDSCGNGGVVWRIRASETKLVCAVGSRNGTEETKLLVLDFDVDAK